VPTIVIINYGVGNLHSARKGLERAGAKVEILTEPARIAEADALVLPGVGAFAEAKKNLTKIEDIIVQETMSGKPLLGICLGLQLLFTRSYEGGVTKGLGLLKGDVVKLPKTLKVPQVGWNNILIERPSPLLEGVPDNSYVYFVHSYFAKPEEPEDIVGITEYGIRFPSILERKNIFATQFHPEKSGDTGLRMLKNFVRTVRK
jgi:glutamine amidotransferase